ncbi:MAG: hypothetical protein AAFQ14_06250 [Cyanobacteria bacterium J06621_12]
MHLRASRQPFKESALVGDRFCCQYLVSFTGWDFSRDALFL